VPDVTEKTGPDGQATQAAERPTGRPVPLVNAPPIVLITIAVLIGIEFLIRLGGQDWEIWAIYAFALIPARFGGAANVAMMEGSQYWSLITYGFLHDGWMHVLLNSVWLLIFGTQVARQFGTLRFLAIAFISTLGGALAMLIAYWNVFVIVVGASAAVSGLLAAAIPVMYGSPGSPLTFGEFLRNRRAIIFMAIFLGVTLLTGARDLPGFADGARVAWEAHIGGFIAGLLSFFVISRERVQSA
jgi:membrane associated rhomboid family serine protease